ncbi:MAG: YkgJ family cysteine cluster protein [Bacteroides sp.]|nr:YkgJ family cysteine cluster protein [Bacteroides sp.]
MNAEELKEKARVVEKANRTFFKSIKKGRARELDDRVHLFHEEEFERTDCLTCANCCRTLGPMITDKDIEKMARALRMKPSAVIGNYLCTDEDGDYVFRQMPCPFLGEDNYCLIYEDRPKACREYPHTDRKRILQIGTLTVRNAATCPAVYNILERLRQEF